MQIRNIFLAIIATVLLSACGTIAQTSTEAPVTNLVAQTDPLVIELDSFENRTFTGDRAYITIYDNTVKGQIPTINGMVSTRISAFASRYALQFDNCTAKVHEPRFNKKGNQYSFTVYVDDAKFFDSFRDTDWRLSFTVDAGGFVTMTIESTTISQVRNSSFWSFRGHVNVERTEALKMMLGK